MNQVPAEGRDITRRTVVRAVLSLAAVPGLACLLLIAVVLAAIECGDTCSKGYAGDWRYAAQLVLAVIGVVAGLVALGLGFTRWTRIYRAFLVLAVGCVLGWLFWVLGFGSF